MKIEKNDKYAGMLIGATMLMILLLGPKENNKINKEDTKLPIETNKLENIIKSNISYDSNIEIVNASNKISNEYKILRFTDFNGYYKIMFTIGYVNYEQSDEVLITTHTICDAFSKEELFKTKQKGRTLDLVNIYDVNPTLEEIKILSYDNIFDLEKYSNKEVNIDLWKNRNLCEYELKEIYEKSFDDNIKVNLNNYKVYQR